MVVEVGIGSFPNALYLGSKDAPSGMDIVGVDPNEYMKLGWPRPRASMGSLV